MSDQPTALVTGATNGIGAEAAVELADRGWRVFVHGRDRERGERVVERTREARGEAAFLGADFASESGVHDLADELRSRTARLDALVLNAGVASDGCRLAWDGVEEMFAVNQLAPYLLAHELSDLLKRSSPARVVLTSSTMHTRGELDFDAPAEIDCTDAGSVLDRYARSKLANLAFATELADRFEGDGVTVNAFHPGFVPGSRLYRHVGPAFRAALAAARLLPFVGTSVDDAAAAMVHLVDDDAVADTTGGYFHGTERATPDSRVTDPDRRELVWSISAELAGVDPDWP